MNRPLVWVTAAYAGGMWLASAGFWPGFIFPAMVCLLWLAVAFLVRASAVLRTASVLFLSGAAGAMLWNAHHADSPGDPLSRYLAAHPEIEECTVEGRVRLAGNEDLDADSSGFLLDVVRVTVGPETLPLRGGVTVRWNKAAWPVFADDLVRATGRPAIALARLNPGTRSVEDYYRRQGIHTSLAVFQKHGIERIGRGRWWSIRRWASELRTEQAERLREVVPKSALPFALAIWLGRRSNLPEDEYESYVRSGTVHILSVSGVHMGMVFVTALFICRISVRNPRRRALVVLACIALFALMSGVRPSSLRAAVMLFVYMAADLVGRERDVPTAMCIAVLILLGWNPDLLFDDGFLLSFLSVASILVYGERLAVHLEKIPWYLRAGPITALAVQVLPTPLAISAFHIYPLAGVLTNLVIVPLSTAALWLCMAASLTSIVSSHVALLFGHALAPIVGLIRWTTLTVASSPAAYASVTSPTALALVAYWSAAACLACALSADRPHRWIVATVVFALASVILWNPPFQHPEVVFLDVGHGDSAFVRTPAGDTLLIDAGDMSRFVDTGKHVVAPFLWANHTSRIDRLLVSHPDRDHIGGTQYLLEHFPVGEIWLPPETTAGSDGEQNLLKQCIERGIPLRRLYRGDVVEMGGATLEVLHPPSDWPISSGTNDASLVFRLHCLGTTILFPGDIESVAESALAQQPCRADVLKVPHHGSRTSSSPRFITAVSPSNAIVSTGRNRDHESADEAVLARYRARGIRVWRTDWLGGIKLDLRRGIPVLDAERPRRGYPYYSKPTPKNLNAQEESPP